MGNPAGDALTAAASTVDPTGGIATNLAAPIMNQVAAPLTDPASTIQDLGNAIVENKYNQLKGQGDQAAAQVGNISGQNYEATYAALKMLVNDKTYSQSFSADEIAQIKLLLSSAERAAHNKAENEARIITGSNMAKEGSGKGGNTGMAIGAGVGTAVGVGGLLWALGTGALVVGTTVATGGLALPLWGVIGVAAAGIGAGAAIGAWAGNATGRTTGGWSGWNEGSSIVDASIADPLEDKYTLDAVAKFYNALVQSNTALFQKIEMAMTLPRLEQGVINAYKDPNATQEQKDQAAKAFVVGAIKFKGTDAMNDYGGKLNEDIIKTMVMQGSPADGKEFFKAMIGAKGRPLTAKEERDFILLYAYGSYLKDPDQKYDWAAIYNTFVEAKQDPTIDPFLVMAEQLPSRKNTGFSGLINQLFGKISALFQQLWKPDTDVTVQAASAGAGGQNQSNQNQGQGSGNSAEPTVSTTSITPDLVAGFTPPKNITGGQSVSQTQTPPRGGTASGVVLNPAG